MFKCLIAMIDTHAHLNFKAFKDDYHEVIKRCFEKGITAVINVGSNYETSQQAIEIAKKFPHCYAAVGLHPIHVKDEEFNQQKYYSLIRANRRIVKAIGETGLDFYRNLEIKNKNDEIKNLQEKVFKKHIELAREFNLPVILHCRGASPERSRGKVSDSFRAKSRDQFHAYQDLLNIIQINIQRKSASSPPKSALGVLHCFSANWLIAQKFINLGFLIGFTGIISFDNCDDYLLEVVKKTPLEKILIETDAPYLAPEPYRGQRCEPWQVKFTAQKIAEIKKITIEKVIKKTTKNAKKLFKLT